MATADHTPLVFDAALLSRKTDIRDEFVWPEEERPAPDASEQLSLPLIDLRSFLSGDTPVASDVARLVGDACERQGFFLVANHGIDLNLLAEVHRGVDTFFSLPLVEKQRAQRKPGENFGYASSFTGRFASKLPWKETLSVRHSSSPLSSGLISDYFVQTLGEDFRNIGTVLQEYCKAMTGLSLEIMEVLGASLGVGRTHFREFFEVNDSIMRLNYYPPCQNPGLTLGTGPHCDPTSLTILHQDGVDGLQVLTDGKWRTVSPNPDAFVVNIGDTFMALSNGRYRSCMHRAVVNNKVGRHSLAFFLSPEMEKVVRPPEKLVNSDHPRAYPDFTWGALLDFTQKHYRADINTFDAFSKWVLTDEGNNQL